jgi:DNA invertase Pin-like site-specific DNA recombinase
MDRRADFGASEAVSGESKTGCCAAEGAAERHRLRSLTEALDTTTAQGRLVFHMFGALAEFERSLIRERTQAGLAAARRLGRTGGRPPKLTENDIEAAKAMLANPDIAVTQIAQRLGISPATLYRYLPAARTANTPGI